MHNVVHASATVVPIPVTLKTVPDGMVAVVAGTFGGEADRDCGFVRRATILLQKKKKFSNGVRFVL